MVEPEKNNSKKSLGREIVHALRVIFLRSWLNVLLIFVPAGIAVKAAGVDENAVFALNAIAVIPLAGLLTFATECLATRFSPTIAVSFKSPRMMSNSDYEGSAQRLFWKQCGIDHVSPHHLALVTL